MEKTNALELHEVTVRYNDHIALDRVTLEIPCGHRVAVIGPNGAGKSTLFKAIVGILPLSHGSLLVFGRPPHERDIPVSYVSQRGQIDFNFPVTVADVVMMGRYGNTGWLRWPRKRDRDLVMTALERVGMAEYANRQIGELSGGQQQRVLIARALAQEAQLLLLDEPFRGVDVPSEQAILKLLEELRTECATVLFATHDLHMAADAFDQMLLLNHRVIAFGPPEQVFQARVLRQAFGGQVTSWPMPEGTLLIGDTHCSADGCEERER